MKARRYDAWVGNPYGDPENMNNCIYHIRSGFHEYQCVRKRGYGKDNLYCKQHSIKRDIEEETRIAQ